MTFPRALALCLIAASMASCNNSSSDCTTCAPKPKPVNLTGTVSGLVGFRLALQNGSTALSIPLNGPDANGNQTFGMTAANTAYNITVKTQPTSPSQTCVVANGMGTTGAGDVTNIAVTCTTNPPRFLYVANRGSGNVSGYTIDPASGNLTPIAGSPFAAGGNPVAIAVDPTGAYAYVVNQLSANITAFTINRTSGALTVAGDSPFPCGANPKALALDPTGNNLYVANSAANTLTGINGLPVSASAVPGTISGSPYATGITPISIAVDPVANLVYVANQGSNTLSGFKIGGAAGTLTAIPGSPFPAGMQPAAVVIDPTSLFAYAANSNSNSVSAYTIDPNSGALTPQSGSPIATGLIPVAMAISD